VQGQPCLATDMGRRLCQHVDRVQLLEQALQGALPARPQAATARHWAPCATSPRPVRRFWHAIFRMA
jgi:LysR family transcriptional regulator (chromosome initiation inhibitor)